jgi:hypothetical protein
MEKRPQVVCWYGHSEELNTFDYKKYFSLFSNVKSKFYLTLNIGDLFSRILDIFGISLKFNFEIIYQHSKNWRLGCKEMRVFRSTFVIDAFYMIFIHET